MPQKFDTFFTRGYAGTSPNMALNFLQSPDPVAKFAMDLLQAPGVLMIGDPDGEDSAGRAKAKERPVRALVERAFDIAQATYAIAAERDLLIDLPTFSEMDDFAKERGEKN